jgi:hypothetical protein
MLIMIKPSQDAVPASDVEEGVDVQSVQDETGMLKTCCQNTTCSNRV